MGYTREFLSSAANGAQVAISNTATPGNALHTAHATNKDEIWLWACNTTATPITLTIEFGSTNAADKIVVSVPALSGDYIVVAGKTLSNSRTVAAFAASAGINMSGHVNRIAP